MAAASALLPELTAISGIGPWTVQGAMLVALRREDVVLPGDLALRKAIQAAYRLDHLPSQQEVLAIAEKWRPYRSLATSHLFSAAFEQTGAPPVARQAGGPAGLGLGGLLPHGSPSAGNAPRGHVTIDSSGMLMEASGDIVAKVGDTSGSWPAPSPPASPAPRPQPDERPRQHPSTKRRVVDSARAGGRVFYDSARAGGRVFYDSARARGRVFYARPAEPR